MCIKRDLDNIYKHHTPTADQIEVYAAIRRKGKEIAQLIGKHCPESRERTISLDKIEEAVMWANSSIARN